MKMSKSAGRLRTPLFVCSSDRLILYYSWNHHKLLLWDASTQGRRWCMHAHSLCFHREATGIEKCQCNYGWHCTLRAIHNWKLSMLGTLHICRAATFWRNLKENGDFWWHFTRHLANFTQMSEATLSSFSKKKKRETEREWGHSMTYRWSCDIQTAIRN